MIWSDFWELSVEPQISTLEVRTREGYRRLWNKELAPRIGAEEVHTMDWKRANALIKEVQSPSVQRSVGRLLKKVCNMAVREGLLDRCPVDRAIQYKPMRKRRKAIIDSLHVHAFMDDIKGLKYEPLLLLELGAGLRVEEACALTWEDLEPLEFMGRQYVRINIDKALVPINGGLLLKAPKNEASRRVAILGEPFASAVLYTMNDKTGPLVANEGRYTSPVTITHNWRAWCLAHDVGYVPPKNLRSSYATIMGEAGAEDSAVSLNMGHSDGTTKGTHYQSATVATKCRAADCLTDWLSQLAPNIPPRIASSSRPKIWKRPGQAGVSPGHHGASDRNRTRNPLITNQLLYR